MKALFLLAVLLGACSASRSTDIPWKSDLPAGARVIYTADHGLGICDGLQGCPTRIVQIGGLCVTETYRAGGGWEFRESKPCTTSQTGAPVPPRIAARHLALDAATDGPAPATATPSPEPTGELGTWLVSGVLAHMGGAPVGRLYLAIPEGPGVRVRLCAARCLTLTSTDVGPSLAMQRADRIADVSVYLFEAICRKPASAGLCVATMEGPI